MPPALPSVSQAPSCMPMLTLHTCPLTHTPVLTLGLLVLLPPGQCTPDNVLLQTSSPSALASVPNNLVLKREIKYLFPRDEKTSPILRTFYAHPDLVPSTHSSQLSTVPIPGYPVPLLIFMGTGHAGGAHTYKQAHTHTYTHTHKQI